MGESEVLGKHEGPRSTVVPGVCHPGWTGIVTVDPCARVEVSFLQPAGQRGAVELIPAAGDLEVEVSARDRYVSVLGRPASEEDARERKHASPDEAHCGVVGHLSQEARPPSRDDLSRNGYHG